LGTVKQVAKIALMPSQLLVPGVLLFVFMGAWLGGASIGAWIACVVFGVVGFFMKRGGWPRPPVILALVLGEILERSFQISTRIHHGFGWAERPIVIVLFLIIVGTLVLAARGFARQKRSNRPATGEAAERNPTISLLISFLLSIGFIWAAYTALAWPGPVRQFPLLITVPGAVLSIVVMCVFRPSGPSIPAEAGHRFRTMPGWCGAVVGLSEMTTLSSTLFRFR
jgi:hypothetical protein